MKKMISLLLAISMVMSLFGGFSVNAAEETNLALNKPATASSIANNCGPAIAVDGVKNQPNQWNSADMKSGTVADTAEQTHQWLQVDLGESGAKISQIKLWYNRRVWPMVYRIETTDTPAAADSWETVVSVARPSRATSDGDGQVQNGTGQNIADNVANTDTITTTSVPALEKTEVGRYVRIYVEKVNAQAPGNNVNLREIEIFGTFAEEPEEENVIKVACVGDSLTEGMKSSGGNKGATAYPAYLQGMLGAEYQVRNFGKSAMTLLKNTDRSYWNTTEFTDSLAFKPNVVLIMLGTNDSKPQYWNEETFKADAEALVAEYRNLETNPRIIFAISPQCFVESGKDITTASVDMMTKVQRALIKENGWETVDMYKLTEGKEELYNADMLHFTDDGYNYLAQGMYDALTRDPESEPDVPTTPVTTIFEDVADTDWFADEVQYIYDKGIMTGVSETTFEPETAVTRATIVQTLYKLEGKPAVSDFTKYDSLDDTLDSIWWRNGLAWALNEGVAKGDSKNNVFNPDNEVTREDLATFIYRYAQYKGVDVELEGTVEGILGDTFVNSWAKTAFAWAIETGLIKGKTINGVADLAPQIGATRAELATIMMRFYENNNF